MSDTFYAVLVLGAMGGIFGLLLAVAAKVFAVEADQREEAIVAVLPGANCGGCGYPGCAGYAAAVVAGNAEVNCCAPGGNEAASKIAEIMGIEAKETTRCVAHVQCSGTVGRAGKKYEYSGISDCVSAVRLAGQGPTECPWGCMGFGTCERACAFGAITMRDGVAFVDREACTGCLACIAACPKQLIIKMPFDAQVTVPCSSRDKGVAVRKYCQVGCIACKICEKTCEYDAIHVVDNLAVIDYDKCVSCGACVSKCPRHLIQDARNENGAQPVVVGEGA